MSEDRFAAIRDTDKESTQEIDTDVTENEEHGSESGETAAQDRKSWETPPYSQPTQRSIHAPDMDWNDYKDVVNHDVDRVLAREFEVRNMKAYEADAAMVRLAAARPDLLAQFILAERGLEVQSDELEL